ncbi:hypothetical protein EU545_01630, partial [Candidatus Thorarchaeota archaeon]
LEYALRNEPEVALEYQYEFLQGTTDLSPERCAIRVPSGVTPDTFREWVSRFGALGVQAGAFTFDGALGPSDWSAMKLRSVLPASFLTIALGRIPPSLLPHLYYLGFDVIDIGHAGEAAEKKTRLWPLSSEQFPPTTSSPAVTSPKRFCSCSACSKLRSDDGSFSVNSVLESHNVMIYEEVLSESLAAMRSGRLRWLVETRTHSSPSHASILRRTDQSLYDFVEEFTPTTGTGDLFLIGPESYNAPTVKRFRDFVANRYQPPKAKRIILLLPCSARKPYSESKSHKRYLASLESAARGAIGRIAQGILTSPLGVIPRELERSYPASVYDIPVTGDWDHEEIKIGAEALRSYLAKFDESSVVVAHVAGGYVEIVKSAEKDIKQSIIYTTPDSSPSRRDSLNALEETIEDLREGLSLGDVEQDSRREIVGATLDYQFGSGAGSILLSPEVRLRGKPYGMILCKLDDTQLCSYIGESGTVSLTLAGAKLLKDHGSYWVRLEAPRAKGGSVFAVGIEEADSQIRPGDEVIVINRTDEVIAVGKSEMSGREMCELARGRAVTIRHKEAD